MTPTKGAERPMPELTGKQVVDLLHAATQRHADMRESARNSAAAHYAANTGGDQGPPAPDAAQPKPGGY